MRARMIFSELMIPSKVNLHCEFSGLDSLEDCLDKDHFRSYPHPVEYHYNSRGFRDSEWPESLAELKNAIWCVGDSFTVGIGSPYNFTWPQVLSTATGRRCINFGMDGASNNWISRRAQQIVKEVAPAHMVVLWSYIHRREHANSKWSDEHRIIHYNKTTDIDDFENFVNCYTQLNAVAMSTNIFNAMIPNAMVVLNCKKIWYDIRDSSWPDFPLSRSEFEMLPEYIQHKIFSQQKFKNQFELMFARTEFIKSHNLLQLTNLDYARDRHHFDAITSNFFVQEVCKTLFSSDQSS